MAVLSSVRSRSGRRSAGCLMTTNSAGFSGAKPTRMLTMPRLMSFCVVVSRSHLTKYASRGVRALERALAEQVLHEGADVQPDLRPQRLVVRLEHHPLRAAVQALLEEQREAAHRRCTSTREARLSAPSQRARAPDDVAGDREAAQAVDAQRIELRRSRRRSGSRQAEHAVERGVDARPAPSTRRAARRCGR